MARWLVLDAGVLGQASHPRRNQAFAQWFTAILATDTTVFVAEITDDAIRRELLRADRPVGLARLNALKTTLLYLPLTTPIMLCAAELWAEARRRGRPTADPQALDCDGMLAAQALAMGATVVTDNVGHLALCVEAKSWRDIPVAEGALSRHPA